MRYLKHIFLLTALLIWGVEQAFAACIQLLEPFSSTARCIQIKPNQLFGTWLEYWGPAVTWAFNLGMALTTLWVLFCGIKIMTAGASGEQRSAGITHMKQGMLGLLVFVFAGSILVFLNSMFFTGS